ncbi:MULTISPECIES: protein kinase domain-containing protein [Calothrix]|uniref:non-specific serine/threonine protein kinase n=2 Tax=Calothrix TaxID=1186 RepID=A0ABR8AC00_9CYAN|nr:MULTISPECIES: protein kinase [Calothrix]MBD2197476.1 protein kinase [Calothrix parietina FACHB-288]MBD2226043.1 protein kinase [Calothrix anomala FACHB-343]
MIGKLLDHRYKVIKVLATGGFGQTYIAQDTRRPGNPICVVKHLKPSSSDPRVFDTAKRLFNSEAETLEVLGQHDQIPRLLAYFDEKQEFYLVQEFIDGNTLSEELLPGQRWSENQVIHLLVEILSVLEYVHSQGVIHRDIKPDNIIRRSSDSKLVLVDFGAVKQLRTQLVTAGVQPSATIVIGTPGYMPTEQGQGKPRPNSDLYSLGIIAIQALTGVPAGALQEDPNTGELLWQHLVNVNSELAAILTKMVRYHFKDRYQNATEALQACKQFMVPMAVGTKFPELQQNISNQAQVNKTPTQALQQKTVAVAPANKVAAKPVPIRPDSNKPDPLPFIVGLMLAGGAAAVVTNVYPSIKNFAANLTGNNDAAVANKCLAVVVGNSNIRYEPSAIHSDNVVQTVTNNSKFEVTGKRTKLGWVQVKLNSGKSAWAHSDVIANNDQWIACLRDKGIAIKTVNDNTLIADRPLPKPQPPKVATSSTNQSDAFRSDPFTSNGEKTERSQSTDNSVQVLEQAKEKYNSGDLWGAIALLKSVPKTAASDFQETADMIAQWQQDWAKADALFNDINTALGEGQWDKVLDYQKHPEKLPNIKYWQDKMSPLFQKAADNLAKQGQPQTEQKGNSDLQTQEKSKGQ